MSPPVFNALTTTTDELRQHLETGKLTSLQIVETYLSHIEAHNTQGATCRAIISTPARSQLVALASELDNERRQGKLRGPLHGIPILIKDNIATDASLGMRTTVGSYTLWDSCPPGNAFLIETLINRGLLVLAKANLTEFIGSKGTSGWSAVGGMCESPYIPSGYKIGEFSRGETTPAGSSTGCAVGVASGFAPLAIGTETSGSVVSPAAAAGLYALKLTYGSVPLDGIMQVAPSFDTLGAFGKSALDVASACDAMRTTDIEPTLAAIASSVSLSDVTVGFVDIDKWRLPAHTQSGDPEYYEQTSREYREAQDKLQQNGVRVVEAFIVPPEQCMVGETNVDDLMDNIIREQAKTGFEQYLQTLKVSKVRSLEDIIQFNKDNADLEFDHDYCPDQQGLELLLKMAKPDKDFTEEIGHCREWATTEGVDKVVEEHGVDVVVCCSDSYFAGVSVASGYPMAAVPLGYIASSGRPYGLQAIAPAGQEWKLVRFMAAWEKVFPPRRTPDLEACAISRANRRRSVGSCLIH